MASTRSTAFGSQNSDGYFMLTCARCHNGMSKVSSTALSVIATVANDVMLGSIKLSLKRGLTFVVPIRYRINLCWKVKKEIILITLIV